VHRIVAIWKTQVPIVFNVGTYMYYASPFTFKILLEHCTVAYYIVIYEAHGNRRYIYNIYIYINTSHAHQCNIILLL